MGIKTGISHRTSKFCLFSLVDGSSVLEVLFGQTEVYDEDLATDIPFTDDKVWWLDIPMYKSSRMDIVYTVQHLDQKSYGKVNGEHVTLLLLDSGQISSQQFHHNERLLILNDFFVLILRN